MKHRVTWHGSFYNKPEMERKILDSEWQNCASCLSDVFKHQLSGYLVTWLMLKAPVAYSQRLHFQNSTWSVLRRNVVLKFIILCRHCNSVLNTCSAILALISVASMWNQRTVTNTKSAGELLFSNALNVNSFPNAFCASNSRSAMPSLSLLWATLHKVSELDSSEKQSEPFFYTVDLKSALVWGQSHVFPQRKKKKKCWQNPPRQSTSLPLFLSLSQSFPSPVSHAPRLFLGWALSTHSQAVCSATYMQFGAVITSVRLFQRGARVPATRLNQDAVLFHHPSPPPPPPPPHSHPFRWWLFFIMLRALLQGFQPDAAQREK